MADGDTVNIDRSRCGLDRHPGNPRRRQRLTAQATLERCWHRGSRPARLRRHRRWVAGASAARLTDRCGGPAPGRRGAGGRSSPGCAPTAWSSTRSRGGEGRSW
ncbi:hypothetical protein HBB16_09935 [Pseudonocardia sp. MCCB 268]|nr:hypothetical protein [Pseudonocardia cytotoxica]